MSNDPTDPSQPGDDKQTMFPETPEGEREFAGKPKFRSKTTADVWDVSLDGPICEDVRNEFGLSLVDLKKDPLRDLRNNPELLGNVTQVICQDEIDERKITARQFGRRHLPHSDFLLDAIREAIIDFFPSGQRLNVRATLAKYEAMAIKTDELLIQQMEETLGDPNTAKRIAQKGRSAVKEALDREFPLNPT